MPRTLSSAIQSAIAQQPSPVGHLLSFSVGNTSFYFADHAVSFQGQSYQPWLIVDSPVRYTQKLQLDPVTVMLQNVSLDAAALLQSLQSDIQGAEATLRRLYLSANDALILFVGRIAEIDIDQLDVTIILAGDLDPSASQVPVRKYSAMCVWDFKDANCGYSSSDPVDPSTGAEFVSCPKDFVSCGLRGRQHRFPGFLHISRDLTLSIEGQLPDPPAASLTLADLGQPWEQL